MVILPHMLIGAAIGARIRKIWLVFVLAWLSHYFLDFLPHWDYLTEIEITNLGHLTRIAIDLILGIILVLFLIRSYSKKWSILIGIIAILLPDILNVVYYTFTPQWLEPLVLFHNKVHFWKGLSFWQGLPATLLTILVAIMFLLGVWG